MLSEVYEFHRETLRDQPQNYREGLRTRAYMGALVTGADFLRGQRLRARLRREVMVLLDRVDALVFPGHSAPAQPFEDVPQTQIMSVLTLHEVAEPPRPPRRGRPAASPLRLPVAIQIVGRPTTNPRSSASPALLTLPDGHTRRPDP